MIYIINKNIEHDLIEKILEYLNISFEYIELNEAELDLSLIHISEPTRRS